MENIFIHIISQIRSNYAMAINVNNSSENKSCEVPPPYLAGITVRKDSRVINEEKRNSIKNFTY